jgi:hypothetical protein
LLSERTITVTHYKKQTWAGHGTSTEEQTNGFKKYMHITSKEETTRETQAEMEVRY